MSSTALPEDEEAVPAYKVQYDSNGFPKTLLDWRREPRNAFWTARHLWDPLEEFFESKGYTLFVSTEKRQCCLTPKDESKERAPDAYHDVLPDDQRGFLSKHMHRSNKLIPATCADGTQVMIQLMCKAGQGYEELEILRYFSQAALVDIRENHVIPILDELEYLDMVFVITPLLSSANFSSPWFYDYAEALEAISQTLEGMAFMHSHLVAHRDFGDGEILDNFGGSRQGPQFLKAQETRAPFRTYFPCRYSILDLELAVRFNSDTDSAARTVQGLPTHDTHGTKDPSKYGKPMPPEWLNEEPYCPFASDVYQVAKLFDEILLFRGEHMEGLKAILTQMTSADPSARPVMKEAHQLLQGHRESLSEEALKSRVRSDDGFPRGPDGELIKQEMPKKPAYEHSE